MEEIEDLDGGEAEEWQEEEEADCQNVDDACEEANAFDFVQGHEVGDLDSLVNHSIKDSVVFLDDLEHHPVKKVRNDHLDSLPDGDN